MEKLILISNDDSYRSKGIEALIEVASKFGRVVVVAPKEPQSGMSQAITMGMPLFAERVLPDSPAEVYSFSGTPVDCMKFAMDHLLDGQKVDLVLSGINHGSNAAISVMYSGTMGAAIEGSFYAPAIGFSLDNYAKDADFEAAKHYAEIIIGGVLSSKYEQPLCLNVNVPNLILDQIKGIKVCRQTRGYWREKFFERQDPQGRDYFWLTGAFVNAEPEAEDSDEHALSAGYVSIVPVQVDMTDYSAMGVLGEMFK